MTNFRIQKKNGASVDYNGEHIFDVLEQYVLKFPTVLSNDLFTDTFRVFKPTEEVPKGRAYDAIKYINSIMKSNDNKIVSIIYGFIEVEFD
jgi:hypothetical protein